ncbi:hypothetical protein COLO4_14945 [Corchorus olitorius]|uniref:Zinc finger, CCHC-type n=1 Tax=Corchorus olitorius TaxID=93759 RepID=A0A1R3JPX0_9ROSI|nr:hypothetical protein COLO4_14945 [Corchorus olitorius]
MVLSNKKLKQKLRAELLAKTVTEIDPNKENPDSDSNPQSLRSLLDSVSEDVATKVYVGGIPYGYTEEDIRYYFEGCGTITDVDCMKFPDTGKFRGIAIISFENEAAAKEALALDRADMGGMQLTIQPYKSTRANKKVAGFAPKMVEGYNRIYVGNLSWDITEDDLKKFFSDCNVSSIRFGKDKETGEFRGYAHVDFSDSVSVAMALKLDQDILCGRPIKISCAVPKGVKTQPTARPTSNKVPASHELPPTKEAPAAACNEALPTTGDEADNGGNSNVSSGKMRRRTCYECGQKGHLSSACPNTNTANTTAASNEAPTIEEAPASNEAPPTTVDEADNGGHSNVSSGKMRRRTCYECGQKGHLSSACPNKKTADTTPASNEAPTANEAPPTTVSEADNGGGSNISSGREYILKGSQLLETSLSSRSYETVTSTSSSSKNSSETYSSSEDSNVPAIIRRKHHSWSEFKELDEQKIYKARTSKEFSSKGSSVSTQTGENSRQRRLGSEETKEQEREGNQSIVDLIGPQASRLSSFSTSEVPKSLKISADIRDQSADNDRPSGRIKASAVIIQLIACGSRRAKHFESMEHGDEVK